MGGGQLQSREEAFPTLGGKPKARWEVTADGGAHRAVGPRGGGGGVPVGKWASAAAPMTPREHAAANAGWRCGSCTFVNESRASAQCEMCNAPSPHAVAPSAQGGHDFPTLGGSTAAAPKQWVADVQLVDHVERSV